MSRTQKANQLYTCAQLMLETIATDLIYVCRFLVEKGVERKSNKVKVTEDKPSMIFMERKRSEN